MNDYTIKLFASFNTKKTFEFEHGIYARNVLFYVEKGSFQYRKNNDNWQRICAGQIVAFPAGSHFFRKMIIPATFCMIEFETTKTILPFSETLYPNNSRRLYENMERLRNNAIYFDIETYPMIEHFCKDMLYLFETSTPKTSFPIEQQHTFIQNNFNYKISIKSLADTAGYSEAHFINLFKKYYGCTPKECILDLRMEKAKSLLQTTDLYINEIAQQCGYDDALYFSRLFRRHIGISPQEFRNLIKV